LTPQTDHAVEPDLFDRPFYKDWIVWLVAFAIFAGVSGVIRDYSNTALTPGVNAGMTGSEFIDIVVVASFQFLLFGRLPAALRRRYRNGRSDRK
jgi:hypothetical protein